jgi:hypothetical protein
VPTPDGNFREPAQERLHFFDKAPVLRKTGALPCVAGTINCAARKRSLTQHHGKMAPARVGIFCCQARKARARRRECSLRLLMARRSLRRLSAWVNHADAYAAGVCFCSRQSNFNMKLLYGTRPEPQAPPDAASRQNGPTRQLGNSPSRLYSAVNLLVGVLCSECRGQNIL